MGCDIHSVLEVRDKLTGEWVTLTLLPDHRNYKWFSIIAGVRSYDEDTPVKEQAGLPADASLVVRRRIPEDDQDLHSHSYLTLPELSEAFRRYIDYLWKSKEDDITELVAKSIDKQLTYREKYHQLRDSTDDRDPVPVLDRLYYHIDTYDDDLNMKVYEDSWYDDIRYVFAFDN